MIESTSQRGKAATAAKVQVLTLIKMTTHKSQTTEIRAGEMTAEKRVRPLRCATGFTDEQLAQAVADGRLTQHDADAVRDFREFLKRKATSDD